MSLKQFSSALNPEFSDVKIIRLNWY